MWTEPRYIVYKVPLTKSSLRALLVARKKRICVKIQVIDSRRKILAVIFQIKNTSPFCLARPLFSRYAAIKAISFIPEVGSGK